MVPMMGPMMGMAMMSDIYSTLKALPPRGEGLGWGVQLLLTKPRRDAQSNGTPIPRPLPHRGGRGGVSPTEARHV
jgi:hypothetical protein